MMNNDFDSCESVDNTPFCNGASPFAVLVKKMRSYNHNIDCVHDWSYCKNEPPAEACVFSPQDIEEWEQEGEKDVHTSDYIGEV